MKVYKAEVFSDEKYQLGESPFYDSRTKTLSWVDITRGNFFTLKDGEKEEYSCGQPVGAAVPAKKAGLYILAGRDGLYRLEDEKLSLIKDLSSLYEKYQRSNDAKADPAGRLWFGSSLLDGAEHEACGNLYCLDSAEGQVKLKQAATKISNGMAWNRNRTKFYFSDSEEHAVFSYDYDLQSGEISNRRILFEIPETDGVSDGMCIDSEDNLWVALWGGRRIEARSGIDGRLLAVIEVDASHVTSCCFYGDSLDRLFITTSGNGLNGEHDGCLFTCKVDVKGLEADYAGF